MPRFIAQLAWIALLSTIAMPFGYMPDRAANGAIILRICDGTMPAPRPDEAAHSAMHHGPEMHGESTNGSGGHEGGEHEVRCNFAVNTAVDLPPGPLLHTKLIGPALPPPGSGPAPLTGIFPASLPPSTGPPAV